MTGGAAITGGGASTIGARTGGGATSALRPAGLTDQRRSRSSSSSSEAGNPERIGGALTSGGKSSARSERQGAWGFTSPRCSCRLRASSAVLDGRW
jgi:hypothetical protein